MRYSLAEVSSSLLPLPVSANAPLMNLYYYRKKKLQVIHPSINQSIDKLMFINLCINRLTSQINNQSQATKQIKLCNASIMLMPIIGSSLAAKPADRKDSSHIGPAERVAGREFVEEHA